MDAVIVSCPRRKARAHGSFAQYRDDDLSATRFDIALQMEDLLPGAQHRAAVGDGDGQCRPHQGRLQVRMAIPVVPHLLVTVMAAGRDQAVEQFGQIPLQPRFVLDRPDGRRASHIEDMGDSRPDPTPPNDLGHLSGNVVQVLFPVCGKADSFLVHHASILLVAGSRGWALDYPNGGSSVNRF